MLFLAGTYRKSVILSEAKNLAPIFRVELSGAERDSSLHCPENHVIPSEAGIHRIPGQRWTPAFAGATTFVTFIPSVGRKSLYTRNDRPS